MCIELLAGLLRVGLTPEIGGSVAYFRTGDVDLMRPLSAESKARGDVLGVAMFPMIPYANRIVNNEFTFGGREWKVQADNPPERFNLHGTAWKSAWTVERCSVAEAMLTLDYISKDEPYSYHASQYFGLSCDHPTVTTTIVNRGDWAMPFGFGQHPWFERDPDVTVAFRASQFWLEGPDYVATEPLKTPPELDFSAARKLPGTWRNNNYGGWDGSAEIRFPSRGVGLHIYADPIFGHLMLYADPSQPFFCLEPQTNAACGLNRIGGQRDPELGLIVLQPGNSTTGSLSFTPFAL